MPGIINTYNVTFNVTNGTNPVEGANVNFRSQDILTNTSGLAIFSEIVSGNNIQYTVTKSAYDSFNGTVSVINQDISEDVILTSSVNVIDLTLKSVKVFPIPAKNIITFDIQDTELSSFDIEFYNYTGKIVKQINSYQNNSSINISDISDGIYLCKIITNEKVEFVKIIIAH